MTQAQTHEQMSETARQALATIRNLRRLTEETGTRTTRAQNDVLRALPSRDLAAVANALAQK